jgi:4-hydroxy-4-methyl-2-oxoglutarate aldolase
MKKLLLSTIAVLAISILPTVAQQITPTVDQVKSLTSQWTGERFPDGRPKVPDALLQRLEKVSMEEAWGFLRNK